MLKNPRVTRLARFILRFAGWVSWIGFILAGIAGYYSIQLYKNLRTDLEELLPTTARSVLDLNEVTKRLESIDNLAILVFSDHPERSRAFVDDLATELQKAPKTTITSVEYKIDRELEFFRERRALFMELSDLKRVRNYIRDKIQYETELHNPLNIFSQVEIPEPSLDFLALRGKYESRVSSFSRFPDGYYATPDGKKRVILAYMPGKTSGMGSVQAIKRYVVEAVERLDPKKYDPGMTIRYTGGVQNTIEEQAALVADLELSTALTVLIVGVALWAFYGAFRVTAALLCSLLIGTLWTFGVSYFLVGYLNANSAFLGAIIIGNGINFPIILLARYMEERRLKKGHPRSLIIAVRHCATATWTAALAAGLAYGSLMLTGFRGFNQFGAIGLTGMVLCWIAGFTLLPAFLTVLERVSSLQPKPGSHARAFGARTAARVVAGHPRTIALVAVALSAISALSFTRYDSDIIEADLKKLRNKESMEHGSGYLSRHVDEIFQRYLSPMVLLPHSRENAVEIAKRLKAIQEVRGTDSMIASVQTIDDFIPPEQRQKIQVLEEVRELLHPRILRQMSPQDRKVALEFLSPKAFHSFGIADLPELVLNKFRERDGTVGKLVLVGPPISQQTLNRNNLSRFIHELRSTGDAVEPGTPVAGSLAISNDMIESIARDGPRATLFAFLAILALVVVIFRDAVTILQVLISLLLGVLWMAGTILVLGLKINFLNFIALPITFGIGIDYGVNIFQRYREEGGGNITKVIRDTGGAVILCSLTTAVGYGSLLIAQNQAFVSFGWLAVIGEVTCLVAAVIAMPAILLWHDRRRKERIPPA